MKSLNSSYSKVALLVVLLALCCGGSTVANARDRNSLRRHSMRGANLNYVTELPQGYLSVYSVSDELNDGAYYLHASYAIYSRGGKLFKTVETETSNTEEIIPWEVALPAGAYTIVGQSARADEVRVHFMIKPGQRTIVDLDLAEQETYRPRLQVGDRMSSPSDS